MASAGKNHKRSRKVVKSTYSKQIRVVRENWKVGERVSWDDLKSRFPEVFPSNGTSNIGRFFELARAKGDIDYDGILKTSGVLDADSVVESRIQPCGPDSRGSTSEISDSGKVTLVKPADYGALRRALYTLGTALRPKEELSAASLQARGAPFEEYTRGALGNFLVWLQAQGELEPFNGKSRRLSARGFKEQTKMNPGKVQSPMPPVTADGLSSSSFVHVDAPLDEAVADLAAEDGTALPEPDAAPPPDAIKPPAFEAVELTISEPGTPKKMRVLPPIGKGDIPTGKNFSTKDRRCLGMLILSLAKVAGGTGRMVDTKTLYPQVRTLCGLGEEVKGNAIGRFFYALLNLELVESWDRETWEGGYLWQVNKEVIQRVLHGEFGELPLERFGVEVKESEALEVEAPEVNEAAASDDLIEGPVEGVVDDVDAEANVVEVDEPSAPADEASLPPNVIEPLTSEAPKPIIQIQPVLETAPLTSGARRVLVRRSALVSRHTYDANCAELRATRAAMEALQAQVRGLPEQLRDIVSDALRRQAEDFGRRLAAEQEQREALQEQLVELRQQHHALVASLADQGEAEYNEVEDLKVRVAELEARIERHLAK